MFRVYVRKKKWPLHSVLNSVNSCRISAKTVREKTWKSLALRSSVEFWIYFFFYTAYVNMRPGVRGDEHCFGRVLRERYFEDGTSECHRRCSRSLRLGYNKHFD